MEKHLTTPKNYPLTINSLMLACNQKSNRDPVMNLTEGQVGHVVNELVELTLARIDYGSRTNKISHHAHGRITDDRKQQAILCMLMLRDSMTLNDIKARTDRMAVFENVNEIQSTLEDMMARDEATVMIIPKGIGQREDRYTHLLAGEPEIGVVQPVSKVSTTRPVKQEASPSKLQELEERIAKLEEQMQDLIG
ncbi:MAG: DUF480 domain-containing protein [Gammaproteobacteria bacterium]|nr:DUF480 domain-containing protein [Gammaproteobacteria bacterium]NNC96792.1 DUF480 domain-containing protein [Gammaproteobacteria bacterium]NNM13404.1 DUF480 domain-containing protein [Gammaproteobacteria bacterium]